VLGLEAGEASRAVGTAGMMVDVEGAEAVAENDTEAAVRPDAEPAFDFLVGGRFSRTVFPQYPRMLAGGLAGATLAAVAGSVLSPRV
jgi:hypothetical protein